MGCVKANVSAGGGEDEVAGFEVGGSALEAQCDLVGFCAGRDPEVVFELPLIAVILQVDARIDALIFDAGELGNAAAPLGGIIADEIVALAGEWLGTVDARR